MSATADVVIIGGAVTGASIAFHLASLGVRHVVLLERAFLAAGATGRSVGIRQLYPTPETRLLKHAQGAPPYGDHQARQQCPDPRRRGARD